MVINFAQVTGLNVYITHSLPMGQIEPQHLIHWLILNRERISNVLSSDMSSTVGVYAIKKLWVYHCPHA